MMSKKAIEFSWTTLAIMVLAVFAMIILVFILFSALNAGNSFLDMFSNNLG